MASYSHDELEALVTDVTLKYIALREIVVRLLAMEATRHGNPEDLFKDFSKSTDYRMDQFPADTRGRMEMVERSRMEVDWIVGAARKVLPE